MEKIEILSKMHLNLVSTSIIQELLEDRERRQNGTREWLGKVVVSGSSTDFFHTWYLIFLLKYTWFTILVSGMKHGDSKSLEIILHLELL